MKQRKMMYLGIILLMGMFAPLNVSAEQIITEKGQTPIQIEIVPSAIRLTEVTPPVFGTYEITNESRSIQAKSDLVISIQHTDMYDSSPWQIDYELSVFENTAHSTKADSALTYKIGSGILKIDGQAADMTTYQAQEINLGQDKRGTLMKTNISNSKNYEYRVPKENISILIPENSSIGEYKAIQTVYLVSLPESE